MIENTNPADLQAAAITIGSFILIGAGANYAQYIHKVETTPEKWRFDRALPTLLVGAAGGLVAWSLGMPAELSAVSGVLGGLVPIVDELRSSSLTFGEAYSIARNGGDSPAASAVQGTEAAMNEVDSARVREGVRDVREAAEESGGYHSDGEVSQESLGEDYDRDLEDKERRDFLVPGSAAAGAGDDEDDNVEDEVVRDGP